MQILITGKNSYIGNAVEARMLQENIKVDKISLRDETWKAESWSAYNSIIHVAGIAHVDTSHATKELQELYYHVNRDLTKQVAKKAKEDGVNQFIYISSVIVYGDSGEIGKRAVITRKTNPQPANFYGDSKLQGELAIQELADDTFKVVVIRTPMVYGRDSKGNFPRLMKLAEITPFFPKIENRRSMIYIDNLCEFIKICCENRMSGLFLPQNKEIVSTSELVQKIRSASGKSKMKLLPGFTLLFIIMSKVNGYVKKVFGNMEIDQACSSQELGYCIYSLDETLREMYNKE